MTDPIPTTELVPLEARETAMLLAFANRQRLLREEDRRRTIQEAVRRAKI